MFRFAPAPLLVVFSCACAAAEADMYKAQVGATGYQVSTAGKRDVSVTFLPTEDIPPLFPVVIALVTIKWHAGDKPDPVEVYVNSSRAGYEEIPFYAATTASWLHVTPDAASTPAKLSLSVDPAIADAVGEVLITPPPGSTWGTVHIRVSTEIIEQAHSEVAAAVNGASFSAGIAPGAIVTLFGSHLGPGDPVAAELSDGAFPTEVAQTTFRLAGVPCPILYVSSGQSNIVIPWGIQPGKHTLEIANKDAGTTYTGTVSLDIAQVAPGIFTLLMNGRGPAAAMNEDYSLNTAANPAKPGSYIMLYATGLGELESKPLEDGAIENRVVRHTTVPTASIGTKLAFVDYAGSAPGFVSALSQVNVLIPPDAPSGEVELRLTTGTASSQDGVIIFVQ